MPEHAKAVARKLAAQGELHPVLQREPPISPHLSWYYERYHEIGCDESGKKRVTDMIAILDERKIFDYQERLAIRALWWQINEVDMKAAKDELDKIRNKGGKG